MSFNFYPTAPEPSEIDKLSYISSSPSFGCTVTIVKGYHTLQRCDYLEKALHDSPCAFVVWAC